MYAALAGQPTRTLAETNASSLDHYMFFLSFLLVSLSLFFSFSFFFSN